jgi:hypothetical protein
LIDENDDNNHDINKYTDPQFLPNNSSIGETLTQNKPNLKVQWIRASKLSDKGVVLFDKIEPNDVAQGKIGNCWLMAALSALNEFPEFIMNTLFGEDIDSISDDCCYKISL